MTEGRFSKRLSKWIKKNALVSTKHTANNAATVGEVHKIKQRTKVL